MTAQANQAQEATSTAMATSRIEKATTGLDSESATALRTAFETMFAEAEEWSRRAADVNVTSETQVREMAFARQSRLALKDIRCNAERARKRLKEDSVRRGRAIDGIYNVLEALIVPIEEHLLHQEKFAERAAKARQDALRTARADALRALGANPATHADLGLMDATTWDFVRTDAELAKEARDEAVRREEEVRQEAERIAAQRREDERQAAIKADAERVARENQLAADNERLRAEAVERERVALEERRRGDEEREGERRKAQADAEARELEARAERERIEAEQSAARERARIDAEARASAEAMAQQERAAKEAAEAQLVAERERVAREQREREETEARTRAEAAAAPDREKLLALAHAVRGIQVEDMSTARGKQIATGIVGRLVKLAQQIEEAAETIAPSAKGFK